MQMKMLDGVKRRIVHAILDQSHALITINLHLITGILKIDVVCHSDSVVIVLTPTEPQSELGKV